MPTVNLSLLAGGRQFLWVEDLVQGFPGLSFKAYSEFNHVSIRQIHDPRSVLKAPCSNLLRLAHHMAKSPSRLHMPKEIGAGGDTAKP